jgi:hypothetical protein
MLRNVLVGLAAVIIAACNPSAQNQQKMTTQEKNTGIVEITTFRLNHGVAIVDFEQAARSMQKDFLEKQRGFINRALAVSADSVWTDIVYWQGQYAVEQAMKMAENSALVLPFMEKIDLNSVKMTLATPVIAEE